MKIIHMPDRVWAVEPPMELGPHLDAIAQKMAEAVCKDPKIRPLAFATCRAELSAMFPKEKTAPRVVAKDL